LRNNQWYHDFLGMSWRTADMVGASILTPR
jgi:hypothetical protein